MESLEAPPQNLEKQMRDHFNEMKSTDGQKITIYIQRLGFLQVVLTEKGNLFNLMIQSLKNAPEWGTRPKTSQSLREIVLAHLQTTIDGPATAERSYLCDVIYERRGESFELGYRKQGNRVKKYGELRPFLRNLRQQEDFAGIEAARVIATNFDINLFIIKNTGTFTLVRPMIFREITDDEATNDDKSDTESVTEAVSARKTVCLFHEQIITFHDVHNNYYVISEILKQ